MTKAGDLICSKVSACWRRIVAVVAGEGYLLWAAAKSGNGGI